MKYTIDDIFRYCRGEFSDSEKNELDEWILESPSNRKFYISARQTYQQLLVRGDDGQIDARMRTASERIARRRRSIFITATNMAAALLLFFGLTWYHDMKTDRQMEESLLSLAVPAGQRADLTLADGTKVSLNSGTVLHYPPVFSGKERKVRIEGEARFDVTHDSRHPFIVETYAADVRVLGTSFVVYAEKDGGEFSTSLIEGRVKVTDRSDRTGNWTLEPNQTIVLEDGRYRIENRLDPQALYWTDGLLNIEDMSFSDLLKRMERVFDVKITVRRDSMPQLEGAVGQIRVSDGIENALKVLQFLSDFSYTRDGDTIYID